MWYVTCHLQIRSLFFGDYCDTEADEPSKRAYDEVADVPKLIARVEEFLMDHNAMSKRPMNLAMFLYAIEHVSRIARVLKQPGGHMLCVGVGGSGRQSLSRLAAFMCGMETFQIEVSSTICSPLVTREAYQQMSIILEYLCMCPCRQKPAHPYVAFRSLTVSCILTFGVSHM